MHLLAARDRTIEAAADGQAPFDITVQNQNADHLGCVDFDALLTAHGMESDALAWRQDTPIYYNDPAVTGIEDASAAIRLSDCNGLLARQGAPAYPGPLPGLLAEGSAPLAVHIDRKDPPDAAGRGLNLAHWFPYVLLCSATSCTADSG